MLGFMEMKVIVGFKLSIRKLYLYFERKIIWEF